MLRGTVTEFDSAKGLGTVSSDAGTDYLFHVIEIADGTRTIEIGQAVSFQPLPKFGRVQAGQLHKL
jgi:cold shock CspA family protein